MFTAAALSPGVSGGELLTSTILLTAVYGVLAVVECVFLFRYARGGTPSAMPENDHNYDPNDDEHDGNGDASKRNADDDVLAFAY